MANYRVSAKRTNALIPQTAKAYELQEVIAIIDRYIKAINRRHKPKNGSCPLLKSLKRAKAKALKQLGEVNG